MCCILLQVPVKVRLVGGSTWGHGPCIVSKVGVPLSDTIYYYRHTFTVMGSLIIISFVTFYGNNFLHASLLGPLLPPFWSLMHTLEDIRDNEGWIKIIQDIFQFLILVIISRFHKNRQFLDH
jgi:hypothetical protein